MSCYGETNQLVKSVLNCMAISDKIFSEFDHQLINNNEYSILIDVCIIDAHQMLACTPSMGSGQPGSPGRNGRNGIQGDPGDPGPQGLQGDDGMPGAPGPQGNPGGKGVDGIKGPKGQEGLQGEEGLMPG
ncbi:hypothetical protein DINM_000935 [Dirofilaria immitis]|nr:hypothetical protein [Dirofilaria immitis]